MSASRSLGSFIAGGLVGAGVALLYAPQSGPATRAYLRRKSRESGRALSDIKERVFTKGALLRDEAARLGNAIRSGVKEELDDAARDVEALRFPGDGRPAGY